jgi:hypothetical protein
VIKQLKKEGRLLFWIKDNSFCSGIVHEEKSAWPLFLFSQFRDKEEVAFSWLDQRF